MLRLPLYIVCLLVLLSASQAFAQIQPHKALYKMSLGDVTQKSPLQDVAGSMVFEWTDTCDGWAQQQHIKFRFIYSDGEESYIDSSMMTWEAKDGKDFTFYVKRKKEGVEDETFKGRAQITDKGTIVKFTLPKKTDDLKLPSGTLFPVTHAIQLLDKAKKGERLFSRKIFDGAQSVGADEISTFIGNPKGKATKDEVDTTLVGHKLLSDKAWPVRMAFFDLETKESAPDYEMDMLLQANGIARYITIDYGDFAVHGVLSKLSKSSQLQCPVGK